MRELEVATEDFKILKRSMQQVNIFSKLSTGELDEVCREMVLYQYDPKEIIIKQGAQGERFFIMQSGRVDVSIKSGMFSKSKVVAALGAGDCFGEMALFTRSKRNATVTAVGMTRTFVLSYGDFKQFLKKNVGLKHQVIEIAKDRKLTNRLRGV
jgi:CRP-like cAMP-binding protein